MRESNICFEDLVSPYTSKNSWKGSGSQKHSYEQTIRQHTRLKKIPWATVRTGVSRFHPLFGSSMAYYFFNANRVSGKK